MERLSIGVDQLVEGGTVVEIDPDDPCGCGECDSGHVLEGNQAKPCKNYLPRLIYPKDPPMRMRDLKETVSKVECRKIFEEAYYQNLTRSIILCGNSGCGKTMAGNSMILECKLVGIEASRFEWKGFIDAKRAGVDGVTRLNRRLHRIRNSSVVFIDEVGHGHDGNKHEEDVLAEIVRICYRTAFLVLATNMTPEEITKIIPGYIKSRLQKECLIYCGFGKEYDLRRK